MKRQHTAVQSKINILFMISHAKRFRFFFFASFECVSEFTRTSDTQHYDYEMAKLMNDFTNGKTSSDNNKNLRKKAL